MPPDRLPNWLVLLGTFLPLLGVLATFLAASATRGRARWLALLSIPATVLALCWWLASAVLYDGNLLAAVLFIGYYAALLVYYPVLLLIAIGAALQRRRRTRRADRPLDLAGG